MEHKRLLQIFGERVRELRLARGWTQDELASRARVTRGFLGRAERGDREPSLYVLLKLATVFGVAPAYLLTAADGATPIGEVQALLDGRSRDEVAWAAKVLAFHLEHQGPATGKQTRSRPLPKKYGR